jgi:hypothetical protein
MSLASRNEVRGDREASSNPFLQKADTEFMPMFYAGATPVIYPHV